MKKVIAPYNPNWKTEFEALKHVFDSRLPNLTIEHVGSTSIEGLYAKPILDIDIIIEDLSQLVEVSKELQEMGYLSKGEQGIADRYAFKQSSEFSPFTNPKKKWQAHHLYVCLRGSLALRNHILFRDILRSNPDLRVHYTELKKSLTEKLQIMSDAYQVKKTEFIISVLASAGLSEDELNEIRKANT